MKVTNNVFLVKVQAGIHARIAKVTENVQNAITVGIFVILAVAMARCFVQIAMERAIMLTRRVTNAMVVAAEEMEVNATHVVARGDMLLSARDATGQAGQNVIIAMVMVDGIVKNVMELGSVHIAVVTEISNAVLVMVLVFVANVWVKVKYGVQTVMGKAFALLAKVLLK